MAKKFNADDHIIVNSNCRLKHECGFEGIFLYYSDDNTTLCCVRITHPKRFKGLKLTFEETELSHCVSERLINEARKKKGHTMSKQEKAAGILFLICWVSTFLFVLFMSGRAHAEAVLVLPIFVIFFFSILVVVVTAVMSMFCLVYDMARELFKSYRE